MAKQLNFEYKGRPYCLEYTRSTVRNMEAMGFNINDVTDKMMIRLPQLFEGAFMVHHSDIKTSTVNAILKSIVDKNGLFLRLREMYLYTYEELLADPKGDPEGNVVWTANWDSSEDYED